MTLSLLLRALNLSPKFSLIFGASNVNSTRGDTECTEEKRSFECGALSRVKFQYATRLSTFASSLCQFPLCLLPRPTPPPRIRPGEGAGERGGSQSTHLPPIKLRRRGGGGCGWETKGTPLRATGDGRRYLLEFAPGGMLFSVR